MLEICQYIPNTLQGEGPYAGNPTRFFRTVGCNIKCNFCDSKYSWDKTVNYNSYDIDELVKMISDLDTMPDDVDITGAEPLLHQHTPTFKYFISECINKFKRTIIETNGSITPNHFLLKLSDKFNYIEPKQLIFSISPKLSNSRCEKNIRYNETALKQFNSYRSSYFKFVVTNQKDIDEILVDYVDKNLINRQKIYLMPEGTKPEEINSKFEMVMNACIKYNFKYCNRLHVIHSID